MLAKVVGISYRNQMPLKVGRRASDILKRSAGCRQSRRHQRRINKESSRCSAAIVSRLA